MRSPRSRLRMQPTRKVEIAGIASVANGLWMSQIGRNLSDAVDGILNGKRYLIHDRDPLFTTEFLDMLADVGVKSVKLPPRSPNLNAHAEPRRWADLLRYREVELRRDAGDRHKA